MLNVFYGDMKEADKKDVVVSDESDLLSVR